MVQGINSINHLVGKTMALPANQSAGDGKAFGEMLTEAVNKITEMDKEANTKQVAFAQGENVELHEVVIAMEKYSVALELLMSVRNKILEAYQEISRMPV
jgi:flagellar hook-basal body complex protein FliE